MADREIGTYCLAHCILQMLIESELMKCCRLDGAGIMFVVDLIRGVVASPTQRNNAVMPAIRENNESSAFSLLLIA